MVGVGSNTSQARGITSDGLEDTFAIDQFAITWAGSTLIGVGAEAGQTSWVTSGIWGDTLVLPENLVLVASQTVVKGSSEAGQARGVTVNALTVEQFKTFRAFDTIIGSGAVAISAGHVARRTILGRIRAWVEFTKAQTAIAIAGGSASSGAVAVTIVFATVEVEAFVEVIVEGDTVDGVAGALIRQFEVVGARGTVGGQRSLAGQASGVAFGIGDDTEAVLEDSVRSTCDTLAFRAAGTCEAVGVAGQATILVHIITINADQTVLVRGAVASQADLVARWAVGVKIGVFGSEGDAFMAETIGRTSTGARTITIVAARAIGILVSGIVPIIAFSGVLAFTIAQGETDEA